MHDPNDPEHDLDEHPLIDCDGFDRAAFQRAVTSSDDLRTLIERGDRLRKGFRTLAQDVFCVFFKYTLTPLPVPPEAEGRLHFARAILGWLRTAPNLQTLRAETTLDEARATIACTMVMERALAMLHDPEQFGTRSLQNEARIRALEHELDTLREHLQNAVELRDGGTPSETSDDGDNEHEGPTSPPLSDTSAASLNKAISDMRAETISLERALESLRNTQKAHYTNLPAKTPAQIRRAVEQLPEELERLEHDAELFENALGLTASSGNAHTKLQLGRHLLNNAKLRRLAILVGRFRDVVRATRRHRFERIPAETHSIEQGHTLARLLPSELALRSNPLLRREFMRRFTEQSLLQYSVTSKERAGRGPMILCIDTSGSMQGDKELWAKAIALSLIETARRQRRPLHVILFSSGTHDLQSFTILQKPTSGHKSYQTNTPELLRMAEYFPGAGTDFLPPLREALRQIQTAALQRADILLITDGQAHLEPHFVRTFNAEKQRLRFVLYAILVDVGHAHTSPETLRPIADRITSITQLTAESLKDIFLSL